MSDVSSNLSRLHVITDEHKGKPVTFDYSELDIFSLVRREQVSGSPIKSEANGYALIGAKISTQGSPGNVLIDGAPALQVGVNHWRFLGIQGSKGAFGCGISSLDTFGSGWKFRAFYLTSNGNIAGRGALKCGYVSSMPKLPVVDWVLEVSDTNVVDAFLFVNDDFRGHAGRLQFPTSDRVKTLRPVVSFDDSSEDCRAAFISHRVMPVDPHATYRHLPTPNSIFECKWKLIDPVLDAPPAGIRLSLSSNGLSVKVCNSMRIAGTVTEDGTITVNGPVCSTLMMPPPVYAPAEAQMKKMIESATGWTWNKEILTIACGEKSYRWCIFREEPVTQNPLVAS